MGTWDTWTFFSTLVENVRNGSPLSGAIVGAAATAAVEDAQRIKEPLYRSAAFTTIGFYEAAPELSKIAGSGAPISLHVPTTSISPSFFSSTATWQADVDPVDKIRNVQPFDDPSVAMAKNQAKAAAEYANAFQNDPDKFDRMSGGIIANLSLALAAPHFETPITFPDINLPKISYQYEPAPVRQFAGTNIKIPTGWPKIDINFEFEMSSMEERNAAKSDALKHFVEDQYLEGNSEAKEARRFLQERAERLGWRDALRKGEFGIQQPGGLYEHGPDYITYNPKSRTINVWDATIGDKTSVPAQKLQSWLPEVRQAIESLPDGPVKTEALKAFKAGNVEGRIYKP